MIETDGEASQVSIHFCAAVWLTETGGRVEKVVSIASLAVSRVEDALTATIIARMTKAVFRVKKIGRRTPVDGDAVKLELDEGFRGEAFSTIKSFTIETVFAVEVAC